MDFSYIKKETDVESFLEKRYKMSPARKTGNNLFYECPWHNDTDASLCFSLQLRKFKCFGPDEWNGDIIDFVMKKENMDIKEACRVICEFSSIRIPEFKPENPYHLQYKQVMSDHSIRYFNNLSANDDAKKYLMETRGISVETIKTFLIGITDKQEYKIRSDLGGISNRISFPILEPLGDKCVCVGMGYRQLSDNGPKYINDQTQIGNVAIGQNPLYAGAFEKGNHLFGLYQAKKEIIKAGYCFLLEGYFDVVSLHQAGIKNAVGVMGATITENQIQRIPSNKVVLIFDGDEAGIKAMTLMIPKLLSHGKEVVVCILPNGYDPADLCKKYNFDNQKVIEIITANTQNGVTYLINKYAAIYDNKVLGIRKEILSKLSLVINEIPDRNERIIYENMMYKKLDMR